MARCGCGSGGGTVVHADDTPCVNMTVDGDGSPEEPYEVSALLTLDPAGGLTCGPDGLAVITPSAGPSHDGTGLHSTVVENSENFATASGDYSVAMGYACSASGLESLAIGEGCDAIGDGAVAIGANCEATGNATVALGEALAHRDEGIAIGTSANALTAASIALGEASRAGGSDFAVAIGRAAQTGSLAGDYTTLTGPNVAIGSSSVALERWSVSLGSLARCLTGGDGGICIGANTTVSAPYAVCVGFGSSATGDRSIAIAGDATVASGDRSIAIGSGAAGSSDDVIAIGYFAQTAAQEAIAIGRNATSSGVSAVSLGSGANTPYDHSVAIGWNAVTQAADQTSLGKNRLFVGVPNSAPTDANILTAQMTVWVDETTNNLTFRVRYAAGTYKTGTVALT